MFGPGLALLICVLALIGFEAFLISDSIVDVGTVWGLSATFMGAFVLPLGS